MPIVNSLRSGARKLNVRVSDPGIAARFDLNTPFEVSKLPGSGPIFADVFFDSRPYARFGTQDSMVVYDITVVSCDVHTLIA